MFPESISKSLIGLISVFQDRSSDAQADQPRNGDRVSLWQSFPRAVNSNRNNRDPELAGKQTNPSLELSDTAVSRSSALRKDEDAPATVYESPTLLQTREYRTAPSQWERSEKDLGRHGTVG